MPIKIAAKVDRVDTEYFREVIKSLLSHPLIKYNGEIGKSEIKDIVTEKEVKKAPSVEVGKMDPQDPRTKGFLKVGVR